MSKTLYTANENLTKAAQEKAKELGLEIKLKDEYGINRNGDIYQNAEFINGRVPKDLIPAIQEKQIRQILLAFQEVLGKCQNWNELYKDKKDKFDYSDLAIFAKVLPITSPNLCERWLNGLNPMFDQEPKKVLEELTTIIEQL